MDKMQSLMGLPVQWGEMGPPSNNSVRRVMGACESAAAPWDEGGPR